MEAVIRKLEINDINKILNYVSRIEVPSSDLYKKGEGQ